MDISSSDMVCLVGSLGGEGVKGVGLELSLVCMAVSQVMGCSIDVPMSFSRCGSLSLSTVCITVLTVGVGIVCMGVNCCCGSSFVCVTVSWVVVFFRVPSAFTPCIILLNPSFATKYPSLQPKSIPLF